MADREIINKGLEELMKMRIEHLTTAVQERDSEQVQEAISEYREAESIAAEFIDVQGYHKRFIEISEIYLEKHSGVLL